MTGTTLEVVTVAEQLHDEHTPAEQSVKVSPDARNRALRRMILGKGTVELTPRQVDALRRRRSEPLSP